MDKLKNTAWFEVNQTIGSRDIIILICSGPFDLRSLIRVNTEQSLRNDFKDHLKVI